MKKISMTQFNDLVRNGRLTITTVIFPIFWGLIALYVFCKPFHVFVDGIVEDILYKVRTWKNNRDQKKKEAKKC